MSISLVTKGMIAGFGTGGGTGPGETIIVEGIEVEIDELGRVDIEVDMLGTTIDVELEVQNQLELEVEVD